MHSHPGNLHPLSSESDDRRSLRDTDTMGPKQMSISPSTTMDELRSVDRSSVLAQLRGQVIVFIGAGSSPEKRALYETAKELGVRSVILDGAGSWATEMTADGTIERLYSVQFSSEHEETLESMLAAVAEVRSTA